MKDQILNFPERGRTDPWPDQIRVSVERPAVETSYSPEVEVGREIPYFTESVDSAQSMRNAYQDALEDFRIAVEEWPIHKQGFGVRNRSEWMYDSVESLSQVTGISFEELLTLEPIEAIRVMYGAICEKASPQVDQIMALESFACGFSTVGPMIESSK